MSISKEKKFTPEWVPAHGTLCMDNYPEIGVPNTQLIRNLRKNQELGDKLILWTCRVGDKLQEAVEWCREHGLLFDAINDNLPEMVEK